MRFDNLTGSYDISQAAAKTENLLSWNSLLLEEVMRKHDWKYGATGEIATRLWRGTGQKIPLKTYRPMNPFTSATAMTKKNDPAIYFNVYKINKTTTIQKAGTILHEYAHKCGFGHGNNYKTKDKCLYSVPYYLSTSAEEWL